MVDLAGRDGPAPWKDRLMNIGIYRYVPTVDGVVGEVRAAADQGFTSFWMPQIFGLDALTTFAAAAREVPDIHLGTAVVPVYREHPMALAQQALTISQLNGGRLKLGIGLSHPVVIESMWGLSYERPLRYMTEYLDALLPMLSGEASSVSGEAVTSHGAVDIAAPAPQVLVAALGPKMLELAGRVADGTVTWMTGPKTLATHIVPSINRAAEAADRPPPQIVAGLPVCVTDDPEKARERVAEFLVMYGGLPSYRAMLDREGASGPEDIAIIGSAAEVAERLAGVSECGVTTISASEIGDPDELAATRDVLVSLL
jgi:F420-dependent oxidoreductase-like protein